MNENHPKSEVHSDEVVVPTTPADPMERYKIRSKANVPHRTYLTEPGNPSKRTGDWLDIRSSLSDAFRDARDVAMQKAAVSQNNPHEESRKAEAYEAKLEMYSSLVAAWSFNVPCTKGAVIEFLRDAPQIQNLVAIVADESETFFGNA